MNHSSFFSSIYIKIVMKVAKRSEHFPCMVSVCTCCWGFFLNVGFIVLSSHCCSTKVSLWYQTHQDSLHNSCLFFSTFCLSIPKPPSLIHFITKTKHGHFFFFFGRIKRVYRISSLNSVISAACRLRQAEPHETGNLFCVRLKYCFIIA